MKLKGRRQSLNVEPRRKIAANPFQAIARKKKLASHDAGDLTQHAGVNSMERAAKRDNPFSRRPR